MQNLIESVARKLCSSNMSGLCSEDCAGLDAAYCTAMKQHGEDAGTAIKTVMDAQATKCEPVAWQHRIRIQHNGGWSEWSEWRDGREAPKVSGDWLQAEIRPLYPAVVLAPTTGELSQLITRLNEACVGYPFAQIPWPHRLLHDAVKAITSLSSQVDDGTKR